MRRLVTLALTLISVLALLLSCEKAPFLTMSGPRSYTFTDQGGSQSFTFTCNRDWKVSSSDSWIRISPSSGTASEEAVTVTITCDANTTYDPRKTTLTVKVEELMETIEVSQETNLGIIVSPKSYGLSSQAQAVEVEVKANVGYKISIDTACKDWISETSTKALISTKHVFNIAANTTYDNREGKIYVRQDGRDVAETITIKQSQVEAIILNETSYTVDHEGGVLKIPVKTNVDITVSIPTDAQGWIKHIETKALSDKEVSLEIASYEGDEDRSTEITFSGGQASVMITLRQKAAVSNEPIQFKDYYAKKICVEKYDKDGDGEVSYREASLVTTLDGSGFFGTYQKLVTSFEEFQYFTGITRFDDAFSGCSELQSIVLPSSLVFLGSFSDCMKLKSIDIPESVKDIGENAFSDCRSLESLVIPAGVVELKQGVLRGTKKMTEIVLPESLEIIGPEAFSESGIKSIALPNNVVLLEGASFAGCASLETIEFPSSAFRIGDRAFANCTSLHNLVNLSSVISIGTQAFARSGLETITVPESVNDFGRDIFFGCLKLQSIKGPFSSSDERCLIKDGMLLGFAQKGLTEYATPEGIKTICTAMFAYDSSYIHNDEIVTVTISEGVESIEYGIVAECTKIKTINLPSTIKEFNTLGSLNNYYTLNCKAIEPPTVWDTAFRYCSYCEIHVPMESVEKYKAATGWSYVSGKITGYNF